jgi:SAM-dependent methyltransferase
MSRRVQYGGTIGNNFGQQAAHSLAPAPRGTLRDGHSGGNATSSTTRSAARNSPRNWAKRDCAGSWLSTSLAETSSFMLQMEQMRAGPIIFDRNMLRRRQQRARALGPATFLLDRVASDMSERLAVVLRHFGRAADLGTPTETVRRVLTESGKVGTIVDVVADEEALPFANSSIDLVVSALALQFLNDLPGALIQIRRALKPDGLLLAALIGGDSLTELREAFAQAETEIEGGVSPRVAPFADVRELGGLLQRAGFALPVVDSDRLTVRYNTVLNLMRDLRRMGATNVLTERRRTPLRRKTLFRLAEIYAERFADADGRLRATFEIAWLSGWAPHERQQKALKPGSASRRLADALGTREIPAGEKPKP